MFKGILIIALGNNFYGKMAYQLAVSLRAVSNLPIALIYNESALRSVNRNIFDHLILAPPEIHTWGTSKEAWIKAKVHVYDLTPFDETLFLDADMLWLHRRPEEIFDKLKDFEFVMQNHGHYDLDQLTVNDKYSQWAKMSDIKTFYRVKEGKFYNIHSEFFYFKKCERVEKLFEHVKIIYDTIKIAHMKFADAIPDELTFAIGMIKSGVYPQVENFVPSYWEAAERKKLYKQRSILFNDYYSFSVGGNFNSPYVKQCYDELCKIVFKKMGLGTPMRLQDKRKILKERQNA